LGGYKFPENCGKLETEMEIVPCDYVAQWKWRSGNDFVDFSIYSRFPNKWTGIGFSKENGFVIFSSFNLTSNINKNNNVLLKSFID
jgi:hypothetical protein